MPDLEDSAVSRRVVLRGAAGAGAAGIAATTLIGKAGPAAATGPASAHASSDLRDPAERPAQGPAEGEAADETIVVHVRDAAAGEIDIYRGTTHTRLLDRELAARLVRASR
jgi:hypothetical protein